MNVHFFIASAFSEPVKAYRINDTDAIRVECDDYEVIDNLVTKYDMRVPSAPSISHLIGAGYVVANVIRLNAYTERVELHHPLSDKWVSAYTSCEYVPQTLDAAFAEGFILDPHSPHSPHSGLVKVRRGDVVCEFPDSNRVFRVPSTPSISINDFSFVFTGYGHYLVTYTSPVTGKSWSRTLESSSRLFADTYECEQPSVKNLNSLKRFVKYSNK